jgi:phage repressor protein C with HTH and peptisase S24 domain
MRTKSVNLGMVARIEARLKHLEISEPDALRRAKPPLNKDFIRNIRRGISEHPTEEKLRRLAKVLECSLGHLTGEGDDESYVPTADLPQVVIEPPGYAPIKTVISGAGAGGGRITLDDVFGPPKYYEEDLIHRELNARPNDLLATHIEGPSMEPLLRNRDQVLFDIRKTSIIEPGLFVLNDGDGVVCKWVERVHGSDPPRIRLKSENPRFDPYEVAAEQAQILGRVVWFARRL